MLSGPAFPEAGAPGDRRTRPFRGTSPPCRAVLIRHVDVRKIVGRSKAGRFNFSTSRSRCMLFSLVNPQPVEIEETERPTVAAVRHQYIAASQIAVQESVVVKAAGTNNGNGWWWVVVPLFRCLARLVLLSSP